MLLAVNSKIWCKHWKTNNTDGQMDETAKVEAFLKDMLNVMVSRAEKEVDAILPGYTHLQVSSCIIGHVVQLDSARQ